MKVIIAGSRYLYVPNYVIHDAVKKSGFKLTEVVQGCASGVDHSAKMYAEDFRVAMTPFDPRRYGAWPECGPKRNGAMAFYADALIIICIRGATWSKGTKSMIKKALDHDIPIYIHQIDEKDVAYSKLQEEMF